MSYQRGPLGRLLFLSLLFFGGLLLGQAAAVRVPEAALAELQAYLTDFFSLERRPLPEMAVSTLVLYFRYPLMAFLLGFASIGVIFLPLAGLAFGFFLSFSVCCFTAVFGSGGVLLALAVFGLRCGLTIPGFFLLAAPSLGTAAALAGTGKRGRRSLPVVYGRACWLRLAVVCGVLLAGVLLDLMISPWLVEIVLGRILS